MCAAIVFGVDRGALAKREVDTADLVPCSFEVGTRCRDATLIAVPETKMQANFGEALETNSMASGNVKRFVVLLQSALESQVREGLALCSTQSSFCALHSGLCRMHGRAGREQRSQQLALV